MEKKVFIGKGDSDTIIPEFTWQCITNGLYSTWDDPSRVFAERFLEHWEDADDEGEFVETCLADRKLALSQGYGELLKNTQRDLPDWWYDEFPPDQQFLTMADAGSVRIGNDGFTIQVGHGDDGHFRVYVYEEQGHVNDSYLEFQTVCRGDFDIMSYDCENDPATHLSGRYAIYAKRNMVVFERCHS